MPDPIQQPQPAYSPVTEPAGRIATPRGAQFLSEIKEGGYRLGYVTIALIAVCVVVAIYSSLGQDTDHLLSLFISLTPASGPDGVLPEVRHGEIWRLLTPMFIHYGVWHIVFNMLWLKDLGGAIEHREGSVRFTAMVVVLALCSDVAQYFVGSPFFGGMSGVVYGLFGYVWLRSARDPASGYRVANQTIGIMLGWFVLCVVGIIPHVANTAHGAGLAVGAVWGWIAAAVAVNHRRSTVITPL